MKNEWEISPELYSNNRKKRGQTHKFMDMDIDIWWTWWGCLIL